MKEKRKNSIFFPFSFLCSAPRFRFRLKLAFDFSLDVLSDSFSMQRRLRSWNSLSLAVEGGGIQFPGVLTPECSVPDGKIRES